jgi:nucleoside-diphosphate-sugar epimerase
MIAITGSTGYIGGKLVDALDRLEIPFLVISREKGISEPPKNSHQQILDAGMPIIKLAQEFSDHKVSGVMHLASKFLVDHGPNDVEDLVLSNVMFGAKLAEAASLSGVKWFVNAGTIWQHYSSHSYDPVNLYSATKQAFQDIGAYYASSNKFKFCTLKIPDTYGPDDIRRKVFNLWRDIAKSGEVLEMSHGNQLLDVVHVDDVVSTLIALFKKNDSEPAHENLLEEYFLTSGAPTTLRQLASMYEEAKGVKLDIRWGVKPYRPREVMSPISSGTAIMAKRKNVFKD